MPIVVPAPLNIISPPEQRHALRARPRRIITVRLTRGQDADALMLADWVGNNQGRAALYPLWHLKRRAGAASKNATVIDVPRVDGRFANALQPLAAPAVTFQGTPSQFAGYGAALIADPVNGHQTVTAMVSGAGQLLLDEPLARPVSAGSAVYPLVSGVLRQAARFDHLAGRVTEAVLDIDLAPPAFSHARDGGWTPPETWQGLPVFSARLFGGTWAEQGFEFAATVEVLDNEAAAPWINRVSGNPGQTLRRRILVADDAAIMRTLGLVDYLRGRQQPLWVDEALAGIGIYTPVTAGDSHIDLRREYLPQFLRTPGVLRIDGQCLPYAGVASESAGVARLQLSAPAPTDIPADACVTRMLRARLDHDAVDLIWHTDGMLEVNLIFRAIDDNLALALE